MAQCVLSGPALLLVVTAIASATGDETPVGSTGGESLDTTADTLGLANSVRERSCHLVCSLVEDLAQRTAVELVRLRLAAVVQPPDQADLAVRYLDAVMFPSPKEQHPVLK